MNVVYNDNLKIMVNHQIVTIYHYDYKERIFNMTMSTL